MNEQQKTTTALFNTTWDAFNALLWVPEEIEQDSKQFLPGEVTVLAGLNHSFKTTFLLNLADSIKESQLKQQQDDNIIDKDGLLLHIRFDQNPWSFHDINRYRLVTTALDIKEMLSNAPTVDTVVDRLLGFVSDVETQHELPLKGLFIDEFFLLGVEDTQSALFQHLNLFTKQRGIRTFVTHPLNAAAVQQLKQQENALLFVLGDLPKDELAERNAFLPASVRDNVDTVFYIHPIKDKGKHVDLCIQRGLRRHYHQIHSSAQEFSTLYYRKGDFCFLPI